jgi:hypothetical protein
LKPITNLRGGAAAETGSLRSVGFSFSFGCSGRGEQSSCVEEENPDSMNEDSLEVRRRGARGLFPVMLACVRYKCQQRMISAGSQIAQETECVLVLAAITKLQIHNLLTEETRRNWILRSAFAKCTPESSTTTKTTKRRERVSMAQSRQIDTRTTSCSLSPPRVLSFSLSLQ